MPLIEKYDPVTIDRDGHVLCVFCGQHVYHRDLSGYGATVRVNFKCSACNRSSQLRLMRIGGTSVAGWFGVSQPHRQISDWGGRGFRSGHRS